MMTLSEKLRITLMFTGIVLIVLGSTVACSEMKQNGSGYLYRVGAWKDINVAAGVPKEMAPWIFGIGVAMLLVSRFTRDK